jgi:hypothetical protein
VNVAQEQRTYAQAADRVRRLGVLYDRVVDELIERGVPKAQAQTRVAEALDLEAARANLVRAENALLEWGRQQLSRIPEYAQRQREFDLQLSPAVAGRERLLLLGLLTSIRINEAADPRGARVAAEVALQWAA